LENLITNAWKFTSKKDKTIIEIGEEKQDDASVFFIKDNGAGFNMDYAEKLFVPFQRLHSSDEYEGTGIGLGIVKRVFNRHGGKIWAESEEGKGTTFYFTLDKKSEEATE
jgi:light-regulated signal transduction histidine kinase (bacteriophytochrome)